MQPYVYTSICVPQIIIYNCENRRRCIHIRGDICHTEFIIINYVKTCVTLVCGGCKKSMLSINSTDPFIHASWCVICVISTNSFYFSLYTESIKHAATTENNSGITMSEFISPIIYKHLPITTETRQYRMTMESSPYMSTGTEMYILQ